jgi:hypothetical protein
VWGSRLQSFGELFGRIYLMSLWVQPGSLLRVYSKEIFVHVHICNCEKVKEKKEEPKPAQQGQ